ncbi:MAG: alpha/beta hydrolase [Bacteroidota bacterium]
MIKFTKFRNIKVRYSDRGKGNVIVLLHGFLESLEVWDEFSKKLSKHFRVISIDLPGHGKTSCIGYIHTMELMAQCVKAVMDSLMLRRYVVVGHSMGGYVTLSFAELFPQNVSGFCLFHSTALADSPERKKDRDRSIELVKKFPQQYGNELVPKLFAPENLSLLKSEIEKTKSIAGNTGKQGIISALLGMKERTNKEMILKNAECPVLFIVGEKDTFLAWETLLLQSELPKYGETITIEHVRHMGFYEAPHQTLKAVKRFARKSFRKNFG